ncbi:hypothetical protein [Streptomyces flaveolus]|uniref:hypothetical protein n=1 Tax=Streptomyces flaveolus TaxID=67297 RepID=UPI001670F823|nr:hypothetical protein [Streptomyces flaveolus]GGQ81002.1 hypothetical protein GCM10010216_48550 [Streptomyces flaveolus]
MSVRTELLRQVAEFAEDYAREHGTAVTVTEFVAHLRRTVHADEKSIPAGPGPREDVATHRHPRPCEFPEVLPCACPRPGTLPEASFIRARKRARIGDYFAGARQGHDDRHIWAGENW